MKDAFWSIETFHVSQYNIPIDRDCGIGEVHLSPFGDLSNLRKARDVSS